MGRNKRIRWAYILPVILLVIGLLTGCLRHGTETTMENAAALQTVAESVQEPLEGGQQEAGPSQTDPAEAELTETGPPESGQPEEVSSGSDPSETSPPESGLSETELSEAGSQEDLPQIDKNGSYTTKEDVALYIHVYGKLPPNFITKKQAEKLGWSGGSLEPYAPGKCIGGNYFGNYEGLLPDGNYRECDIGTLGKKSRGKKRLIYSDDGRIYYTGDHYASFTQLY